MNHKPNCRSLLFTDTSLTTGWARGRNLLDGAVLNLWLSKQQWTTILLQISSPPEIKIQLLLHAPMRGFAADNDYYITTFLTQLTFPGHFQDLNHFSPTVAGKIWEGKNSTVSLTRCLINSLFFKIGYFRILLLRHLTTSYMKQDPPGWSQHCIWLPCIFRNQNSRNAELERFSPQRLSLVE